jgi:hypothetical protein
MLSTLESEPASRKVHAPSELHTLPRHPLNGLGAGMLGNKIRRCSRPLRARGARVEGHGRVMEG